MRLDPGKRLEILQRNTPDKQSVPIFWDGMDSDGKLIGKRNGVITLVIPVSVPEFRLAHGNVKVMGDGKVLTNRDFQPDSWLRNFFNMVSSDLGGIDAADSTWGDGYINGKDIGGTVRSSGTRMFTHAGSNGEYGGLGYLRDVGVTTGGIVLGTDDTAVDWQDDYALGTQIAHGKSANQLYYATSPIPAPDVFDSGSRDHIYSLSRFFDNFSGTTITAKEMALYSNPYIYSQYNICLARDVLTPVLDIPYRAQAQITYTFTLNFPTSGSPLRNYYNRVMSSCASLNANDPTTWGDGYLNRKIENGTVQAAEGMYTQHGNGSASTDFIGGLDVVTRGIVVGTDDTAVQFNDYCLGSKISDGNGTGELEYSAGDAMTKNWDSGTDIMTIEHARMFSNDSGATVTVRESGFLVYHAINGSSGTSLYFRDTFTPIGVENSKTLRIVYQLDIQYPT